MATRVLRNVDLQGLVAKDLPLKMAAIHKATAKEYALVEGFTENYSTFAFRRNQKPRKYSNLEAIPETALYVPASIGLISKRGENYAVDIATEFLQLFNRLAPSRTGRYKSSIRFDLNGKIRALSTLQRIRDTNPLSAKETVSIWSAVEYASTLEAPNYNVDGIFLKIAKILIAKWGAKASIKFTYISGAKKVQGFKLATPMIMISARGTFATSITTRRGYQMRKRDRKARRGKLDAINAQRAKSGLKPYKRLPRGSK